MKAISITGIPLLLVLFLSVDLWPQDQNRNQNTDTPCGVEINPPPFSAAPRDHSGQRDQPLIDMQKRQAKERNKERQSALQKDTDKLQQLATELKARVQKSNENQLSLEVIRTSQEIEKLAKQIREKMTANGYCDFFH